MSRIGLKLEHKTEGARGGWSCNYFTVQTRLARLNFAQLAAFSATIRCIPAHEGKE